MNSPEKVVIVEKRPGHVAIVRLNRPHARNAINVAVTDEVGRIVADLEQDQQVRVVVLTGSSNVFSAGADLKEVAEGRIAEIIFGKHGLAGFVHASRSKPWIAAVEGFALAGGCELALACDLIIASNGSLFGLPEVTRGLIASAGGAYRLPRTIPRAIAIEQILTGQPFSAERAYELGMVNRLVPQGETLLAATELAERIAANAPIAVRESLALARKSADLDDQTLRVISDEVQRRVMLTEDFSEGPRAFVEKRLPNWKGR